MSTSAVRPTIKTQPEAFAHENAVRYGILMGGPKEILCNGIGEYSVGHDNAMPRRTLIEFIGINVGRKNESEEALTNDSPHLHKDWHKNPSRVVYKSPLKCAIDVSRPYKDNGFVVPDSLVGHAYEEAVEVFDSVLPREVAELPLTDVVRHLSSLRPASPAAEQLRDEMLAGAYTAQNWIGKQVRDLKSELGRASKGGPGIRALDDIQGEYFRELKEPLPEEIPALATLAMGKELGKQFAAGGNRTDLLLEQLIKQNQLKEEELRLLKEQHGSTLEGSAKGQDSRQTAAESAPKTKGK